MSMITAILGLALMVAAGITILIRNDRTYRMRDLIIQAMGRAADEENGDFDGLYDIYRRYGYNRMLFSFRPLRLTAWYSVEDVVLILSNLDEIPNAKRSKK